MKIELGDYPDDLANDPIEKIQIDPWDTWSLDYTLAKIIAPAIKQLKENTHGSPESDPSDAPEHITDIHERWNYILGEMQWAFEAYIAEDRESQFWSGEMDTYFEELPDGNFEMKFGPNHTHKTDEEAKKKHEDRIQNGINLFAKYYANLWN